MKNQIYHWSHDIDDLSSNLHIVRSEVSKEKGGQTISAALAVIEKDLLRLAEEMRIESERA